MPKQVTVTNDDESGTAVVVSSRQRVERAIAEMARDTSQVSDRIMANILDAESADDVFAQTSGESAALVPSEHVLGIPLHVVSVQLNPSQYADGPPAYAVIDAVNMRTQEPVTVGCGAGNIVAGLIKLHQLGMLPVDVVLFESGKRTANGFTVTLMRRATERDMEPTF